MTAHITMPAHRSAHGPYFVAVCSCGHREFGTTRDQARQRITTHRESAQAGDLQPDSDWIGDPT